MTINKNYTIERIWVKDEAITNVRFRLDFTSDELPGVTSTHFGEIPVSTLGLTAVSTNSQIADAIDATLPPGLEDFHNHQLQFMYDMETSTPVDRDMPEPNTTLNPLTARQLRLGLVMNDISLANVEATINAIENPQDKAVAQIEWEYASQFERDHPLIAQVGGALGLSEGQIDIMWAQAQTL